MISIAHYLPLIGPYILAQKKLEKEGKTKFKLNGVYSFPRFKDNEQHIEPNHPDIKLTYFDDDESKLITQDSNLEPWYDLIKKYNIQKSNIITGVPICSGLSMLNSNNKKGDKARGADAVQNNWMFSAVKFYLATDSDVLVIENAPALATSTGLPFVNRIISLIKETGFNRTVQLIKTTTCNHGIPQERKRTFLYIHKGEGFVHFKNKIHEDITLEQLIEQNPILENDPCAIFTDESEIRNEWLDLISKNKHFIDRFKSSCVDYDDERSQSLWKLILDNVKSNPSILEGYPKLQKMFEHIKKKHAMNMGFWDGSPSIVKGKVNAVISKNRLSTLNPCDDYNSLLTVRHFMHLMGMPSDFNLVNPENTWKHICQNVPVNTAADSILWAIECLNNSNLVKGDWKYTIHNNLNRNIENEITDENLVKIKLTNETQSSIFDLL